MHRPEMIALLLLLAAPGLLAAPLPATSHKAAPPADAASAECRPGKIVGGGLASWYGEAFRGKRDARGKRFDPNGLSAAHRTLPLNSFVQVKSRRTGRSVVVKITDRGPYEKDRVIDLSREAARELGFSNKGVARVTLRACAREG